MAMVFPPLHNVYSVVYPLDFNIRCGHTVSNGKVFGFVLLATFLHKTNVVVKHARLC